jgi:hypothetical protein
VLPEYVQRVRQCVSARGKEPSQRSPHGHGEAISFSRQALGERYSPTLLEGNSQPDQAALSQSDVQEVFIKMARAAFQQGSRGVTWEYKLFTRPWGFRLEEISMPVYIWH